jgi:hypothetical protein
MDADLIALAAMINGEGASADFDTKVMMGSTAINRLKAQRLEEFGGTLPEVTQKGYYAVKNQNIPYQQAITGKFPDKKAENAWKQSLAIASGLIKGTIPVVEGQFFFKSKEKPKMNWKLLKEVGNTGGYKVFSYK